MSTLSERINKLKDNTNTSIRSGEKEATSLKDFLHIYVKAEHECYVDYMRGAQELYNYLSPILIPTKQYPAIDTGIELPDLLMSYELTELAKILTEYKTPKDLLKVRRMERAIIIVMKDLDFLDINILQDTIIEVDTPTSPTSPAIPTIPIELAIYKGVDPRLKLISNSSRITLHKCPRKFQLYRLNSKDSGDEDINQGITYAYGKAVGVGIQSVLEGKSDTQIFLDIFFAWDIDLIDRNDRQKKSFWEVVFSIQKFIHMRECGYLDEYELVYYEGKPAIELSFKILLPDGFSYRGYVDAVLQHKKTKAVIVLECKTSSGQPNSAQYKNSGQALGYSVILDILFPTLSSYTVLYLVYYTKGREYIELHFDKSLLQRALWLQELLIDSKHIELYESFGTYPMHGESCYDFFKPCEYLGLCTLSTENLITPLTVKELKIIEEKEYMFTVDLYDLVEAQLKKGGGEL